MLYFKRQPKPPQGPFEPAGSPAVVRPLAPPRSMFATTREMDKLELEKATSAKGERECFMASVEHIRSHQNRTMYILNKVNNNFLVKIFDNTVSVPPAPEFLDKLALDPGQQ